MKQSEKKRLYNIEYSRKYRKTLNGKYLSYKHNAKFRGIGYYLTPEQFFKLVKGYCYYCNKRNAGGVDRLDSKEDYIINNCKPCCRTCNIAKNDLSLKDFKKLITKIYNNLKRGKNV